MKYVDHKRRHLLRGLGTLALLGGFGAPAVGAERDGARKTLRLIVSAPPGGTPDIVARHYAEHFGTARTGIEGESVVVENRPGAGGVVAVGVLCQAPPDGSAMLLIGAGAVTMYPHLYRRLPYDPVNDLMPVSLAARLSYGLAVGPAVPEEVRDLRQLLAWARGPAAVVPTYGSPGTGTVQHVLGATLFLEAGIDAQHVPYPGGPQAIVDLLGGRLSMLILPDGLLQPHRAGGSLRVLATFGTRRTPLMPDVPTAVESGFSRLVGQEWLVWFAPRGTPSSIVAARAAAARAAAAELVMAFAELGIEAMDSTPAELVTHLENETRDWARRLAATSIRIE